MSSKSSIFFTSKELISFTRIFNREYIVSAFSWSSCLKLLNLSMRTWYLSFATSFVPSWFSLIVFHKTLAFLQENTWLNTFSPREFKIAHLAIASYCFSCWLLLLVPSLVTLQTFRPLAWRCDYIKIFHRWKPVPSKRVGGPTESIPSPKRANLLGGEV